MSGPNIYDHATGRFLHDSLAEASWAHPEFFDRPEDGRPSLPKPITDSLLAERITTIFDSGPQVQQCQHLQRKLIERLHGEGMATIDPNRLYGLVVYAIAAVPQARLCALCAEHRMRQIAASTVDLTCTRCERETIKASDAHIHSEMLVFGHVSFHVGNSCRDDLQGASHD